MYNVPRRFDIEGLPGIDAELASLSSIPPLPSFLAQACMSDCGDIMHTFTPACAMAILELVDH